MTRTASSPCRASRRGLQQRRSSVGSTLRAMILPPESSTVADVVAWCTSSPTYLVEHLLRAASCCGERVLRNR